MATAFEYRLDLLKQEMETLQNGIRSYDTILFTIKGWAITIFSATTFFAIDKQRSLLYIFCAVSVVLFWLLDAVYESIQRILPQRYRRIEKFMQSEAFDQAVLDQSLGDFRVPDIQAGFAVGRQAHYRSILQEARLGHTYSRWRSVCCVDGCSSPNFD